MAHLLRNTKLKKFRLWTAFAICLAIFIWMSGSIMNGEWFFFLDLGVGSFALPITACIASGTGLIWVVVRLLKSNEQEYYVYNRASAKPYITKPASEFVSYTERRRI